MDAPSLTQKLQSPENQQALASLVIEVFLDRPLDGWLPKARAVELAREALTQLTASETAEVAFRRVVEQAANELQPDRRTLETLLSRDVQEALRTVMRRPFSPDRKLTLTLLDRAPARALVREMLLAAILDFAKKASAPMAGMTKGLGSLARLAGETAKSRTGAFGSIVGAVSGEVERQVEKRAVEFVDSALSGIFSQMADVVSDPRRAGEAAELRLSMLDGALELTLSQLGRELVNADLPGAASTLREGVKRWLSSPDSTPQLEALVDLVLRREGARTARQTLTEWGLLELVQRVGPELLAARIADVVASGPFAAWLTALMA